MIRFARLEKDLARYRYSIRYCRSRWSTWSPIDPLPTRYRSENVIDERQVARALASRISCKIAAMAAAMSAAASGSRQNEIRRRRRPENAHETRRCRRQMRRAIQTASIARENIREYSTCKFIEILRTPALRREMYSRRSGDTSD